VLDVRFLQNPYYVPELRPLTGQNDEVYDYVFSDPNAEVFVEKLREMFRFLLPLYLAEGKTSLVIAIGCTGGRHRSVSVSRRLHRELLAQGLEPIVPGKAAQKDVMHLIFENVKAGTPAEMDRFFAAAENLRRQGAEAIILGCTELSLIKRDEKIGPGFLDAMEVLAKESVLACGKPVKPEYHCLITR